MARALFALKPVSTLMLLVLMPVLALLLWMLLVLFVLPALMRLVVTLLPIRKGEAASPKVNSLNKKNKKRLDILCIQSSDIVQEHTS